MAAFWMARAKMRDMEGQKRYAEILGRILSDLAGVPLWSKDSRPDAWNGVKC